MTESTASEPLREDLLAVYAGLAEAFCAGQPLLESLRRIQQRLSQLAIGPIVAAMADDVEHGASLSSAMSHYAGAFPEGAIRLVEAGELLGIPERTMVLLVEATWRCPDCKNL